MTARLAKQLKLTLQYNSELLSVSTFAARKSQDVSTYVVEFNVMTKDNTCMHFHANVIEQITEHLHREPLQPADMVFLVSVSADRLADSIPDSLEASTMDLLIVIFGQLENTCMHFHANVIEQITGHIHREPLQPADMIFLMSISADRLADSIPDSLEPNTMDLLMVILVNCRNTNKYNFCSRKFS